MRLVLLVRHADTRPPTADGPGDLLRPLTPLGLEQAEGLVEELSRARPTRVVSSPYLRAVQTVLPTAEALGLEVERVPALREWDAGLPFSPEWRAQYRQAWDHPLEQLGTGETHDQLERRALSALSAVTTDVGHEVAVLGSHGAWVSRCLRGLGSPVDADSWFAMPMPAVYRLQCGNGVVHQVSGPGLPP